MRPFLRRFQSTCMSHSTINASLDLDFVLNLLDPSKTRTAMTTAVKSGADAKCKWSTMKFKVIEMEGEMETEKDGEIVEQTEESMRSTSSSIFKRTYFGDSPENPSIDGKERTESSSQIQMDTLTRLQNLANSLPTQIYDRHGNLIPLNTSQPPTSFFEMDSNSANARNVTLNQQKISQTAPIFHRDNVDWRTISITSILKKIVPEEVFMKSEEESKKEEFDYDKKFLDSTSPSENVVDIHSQTVVFRQDELRLLDRDQLHALAKHFSVSCDLSDLKIEQKILKNQFDSPVTRKSARKKDASSDKEKEKVCWTEENEGLLVNLYEELRIEKHKLDLKLISLLNNSNNNNNNNNNNNTKLIPSLKRGNGASDRGLWAVLAGRMRVASKSHASVSECRNKLIILKRLKA